MTEEGMASRQVLEALLQREGGGDVISAVPLDGHTLMTSDCESPH